MGGCGCNCVGVEGSVWVTALIAAVVKYVCEEGGEGERECVCMSVGGCGCDCISMEVCVGETAFITAVKYV